MPLLTLSGLSKRFANISAVSNVNLEIPAGEFVALLGPSGSGKTTLLRMLAGFELPTSGSIMIGNRDVSKLSPGDRDIGMVFQQYALFPHLNVRKNIEYGLKMRAWPKARRIERTEEILQMVRLGSFGERFPRELSGGQQQRVAIARALAYSPNFLLMDEPLGALDRALRIEMAEEIRRIHRSLGTTFIYVTHDRDEAMTLASRVLVINRGEIIADGPPEQLYKAPDSSFVATFFSGMNVVDSRKVSKIALEDKTSPATARHGASLATPPMYGVPPSRLSFHKPDTSHIAFTGEVVDSLFLGDTTQTSLKCPELDGNLLIHAHSHGHSPIRPGERLTAYIDCRDLVALRS